MPILLATTVLCAVHNVHLFVLSACYEPSDRIIYYAMNFFLFIFTRTEIERRN